MGSQKRSENTYQKINTIFQRDTRGVIMPDRFSEQDFEYLRGLKWYAEEKIDGTNMRIEVKAEKWLNENGITFSVRFAGKTDNAEIPKELKEYMEAHYPEDVVLAALGLKSFIPRNEFDAHGWNDIDDVPDMYTIYGEGYGRKIQKVGAQYIADGVGFIIFDVKVNNLYLKVDARNEIAAKMATPVAPNMGYFTLDEAIDFVRKGFKSNIAEDKNMIAEGLVLRTDTGLLNRMGKRLIVKVKHQDFVKYRSVQHLS